MTASKIARICKEPKKVEALKKLFRAIKLEENTLKLTLEVDSKDMDKNLQEMLELLDRMEFTVRVRKLDKAKTGRKKKKSRKSKKQVVEVRVSLPNYSFYKQEVCEVVDALYSLFFL